MIYVWFANKYLVGGTGVSRKVCSNTFTNYSLYLLVRILLMKEKFVSYVLIVQNCNIRNG